MTDFSKTPDGATKLDRDGMWTEGSRPLSESRVRMTKGNEPAFPTAPYPGHVWGSTGTGPDPGISTRLYLAAMAMQGDWADGFGDICPEYLRGRAKLYLAAADALLAGER